MFENPFSAKITDSCEMSKILSAKIVPAKINSLKGIPRSKYKLISYERASKNMKNAFYFMQKCLTGSQDIAVFIFKAN